MIKRQNAPRRPGPRTIFTLIRKTLRITSRGPWAERKKRAIFLSRISFGSERGERQWSKLQIERFTFGTLFPRDGIHRVPVTLGRVAVSEMMETTVPCRNTWRLWYNGVV
ncbi:MAG: hypothetical protein A2170_13985 [Deltaproteobacteria bacterium RBG_13_53_10]|nr:MAG: hypothetical protein A2170_13985 [Deltaproteobacteria bacterium RBG_13_53_10]